MVIPWLWPFFCHPGSAPHQKVAACALKSHRPTAKSWNWPWSNMAVCWATWMNQAISQPPRLPWWNHVASCRFSHVFSTPGHFSQFPPFPRLCQWRVAARQRSGVAGGSKRWLGGAVRGARAVQGPGGGDACRFFGEMKGFPGGKMGVKPCN